METEQEGAEKWCPTQGGEFTAYLPEWRLSDTDDWADVPIKYIDSNAPGAQPFPRAFGGICSTICLFGYAQAQAMAWGYAAGADEVGKKIEVRVQAYKVVYDIKAQKIDP